MATFFLRIRSHFVNSFNTISWEPLKITSQKSPKTSDSWNTEILPIPTAISTKTGSFELKYKGRRTRNTQVCRHKITAYVYLSYMSSCARPISEKLVFEPFLKSGFSDIFWGLHPKSLTRNHLLRNRHSQNRVSYSCFRDSQRPEGP